MTQQVGVEVLSLPEVEQLADQPGIDGAEPTGSWTAIGDAGPLSPVSMRRAPSPPASASRDAPSPPASPASGRSGPASTTSTAWSELAPSLTSPAPSFPI